MFEVLSGPWHWSISGAMIVLVMFLLLITGHKFGVSTSFRVICATTFGRKSAPYFDIDWRDYTWLMLFVLGSIIGGFIGSEILRDPNPVQISQATINDLSDLGISAPQSGIAPLDLFNFEFLMTLPGFILFILGGFAIGFGTRWAGGCTSGHAISGLSNLQLPSLIAVIGFFIGGLFTTFIIYPLVFSI